MNDLLLHPALDIEPEIVKILDEIDRRNADEERRRLMRPMWVCLGRGPYGCGRVTTERPEVCDRCGHDHRRP